MNYDTTFAEHVGKTVRAGLIGARQFGASFVGQAICTQFLDIPALSELDPEHAAAVFIAAGYDLEDIVISVGTLTPARAVKSRKRVAIGDAGIVLQLPLDIIVEAKINPEAAAAIGSRIGRRKTPFDGHQGN
jgi:predicted homoserine dehydrogenase-like protein